jgi:hypothetical protein
VDGVVAAFGRADGVGRPGIVLAGLEGVVGALAVDPADRVHRREVDDVEAHVRDGRQPALRRVERAAPPQARLRVAGGALGAREDLVPRAVQRPLALDQPRVAAAGGDVVAQRPGPHLGADLGGGARPQACLGRAVGVAQGGDGVGQRGGLLGGARDLLERALQDPGAFLEHQVGVDVGLDLDRGVVVPGGIGVRPSLDAVGPHAGAVGADGRGPVVEPGAQQGHRDQGLGAGGVGEDHGRVDRVVPLPEHRRGDVELLLDDGLGRERAAVDVGCHVQHGDASQRALGSMGEGARCHAHDATGSGRARIPGRSARSNPQDHESSATSRQSRGLHVPYASVP